MLAQERSPAIDPADDLAVESARADDLWLAGPRKGVRVRVPALLLTVLAVAVFGVWGGAKLQKSIGTTSGSAASAGAPTGATGPGGQGGTAPTGAPGQGGPGGATSGTVTSVDGNVVTLTTSSGSTVKVTVGDTTTINRSLSAKVSDITAGQTLMVRGTTGTDGATAATSITVGATGQPGQPGQPVAPTTTAP
jgi:hypothetical protein